LGELEGATKSLRRKAHLQAERLATAFLQHYLIIGIPFNTPHKPFSCFKSLSKLVLSVGILISFASYEKSEVQPKGSIKGAPVKKGYKKIKVI